MAKKTGLFDKLMAIIAYLYILFLIPLIIILLGGKSKFVKFHTNQGIVAFLFALIGGIIVGVITALAGIIPVLGGIVAWAVGAVFGLISLALVIYGIFNAVTGKQKELPIIGKIRIIK